MNILRYLSGTLLCLFATFSVSHATTVLQLELNELLEQAELVFEGTVISSEARWNEDRTSIVTIIQFAINDVIKGKYKESTLELQFEGGTVDGMTLQIADMLYPALGDQGIYFVEQLNHAQINPLLGWSQGHFRILKDASGDERIFSAKRSAVRSLSPARPTARQRFSELQTPFSEGVAAGITTSNDNGPMEDGMKKGQFKNELRTRLHDMGYNDVP